MADDKENITIPKPRKSKKSKESPNVSVPSISAIIDDEVMVKNKKKKKVSKESLGNNTAGTSSGNNPAKPKKKKSKKKTSKEELLDPILAAADPSNRSELNLLAALENPIVPGGGGGNVSDDSTTQQEEQVEKPNKKRKKKKPSPKTSETSLRDQLADSHSSLRDYFPDPALRNYLQGLYDDVESMDGGDDGYETPRVTPSPTLLPHFPPSQHSDKVFLEKDSGFRSTSQRKLATNLTGNQIQNPDLQKPTKTPLDVSLESQRVFRSIGIFCHGFLAGLAFWQLIMVFILSEGSVDLRSFIELYSPLSQPLHLVFYFLTVICTISILDRYDIAKFEWRQLQKLLTFKSGGFAILIYSFTLIITLVTTKMDDKLSLYQHNSTLFNNMDDADLQHEMTTWKILNLCRSIAVIFGWMIVSLRPNTDLLYKNLEKLSNYNTPPSAVYKTA